MNTRRRKKSAPPQALIGILKPEGAVIWLAEALPATCCDGRMTFLFVNRGGRSYCSLCDPGVSAAQKAARR